MSVLIKGIEMPKNCCACPLFKSNMSKQLFCKAFGAFDKSDYDKLPKVRMKNCPLVPVPKHGDLIDRDALPWIEGQDEQDNPVYLLLKNNVDVLPTIIPASEEGAE